jgi:isocitrate/isopropylmalate dehydrogenase
LGQDKEAKKIEHAVKAVLEEGKILTPDLGGTNCTNEVGDAVKARIKSYN